MNNDKPSSESSHSPTEQPGDAKHTPLPQGKYYYGEPDKNDVKPVFGAHDQLLWFSAPGSTTRFSDEKEAGRAAKIPALLSEVSTLRSKQDELVAENERLKELCLIESRKSSNVWNRKLESELEQLRSERDKMREALQIIHDHVFKSRTTLFKVLESALSGGRKQ